ncbi:MAG: hypothetical protein WC895_02060 [Candidatus Shapirobacteria bacterium]|jgi:hypothetical protein
MKIKIIFLFLLTLFLIFNVYSLEKNPDIYTQAKINLSQIDGSSSYLGRLNLWHLLVQNNDWENAATLELKLNQDQIKNYKLTHQPSELQKKIDELKNKSEKTTDDYLELSRIQSILGFSNQAIDSIKKAHQLDLIRSDVDRLFYQTSQ